MTALTKARNTDLKASVEYAHQNKLPILDTEKTYAGGLLAIDYAGEVQMASDTAGLRVIGLCDLNVDNTDDGEYQRPAKHGIVGLNNSATYPLVRTAKGSVVYVEDDNTVAADSSARVPAGILYDVDADGVVWVDVRPEALAQALREAAPYIQSKSDDYSVTAAEAFQGNCLFVMAAAAALKTFTLPSVAQGYRVGFIRQSPTAGDDVSLQAAAGDTVLGSAAAKKVDNTTDAISHTLWIRGASPSAWVLDSPVPGDYANWVINNA